MISKLLILCGGKATRLNNLTKKVPKSLLPIGDKVFLDLQINYFLKNGIKEIIFCVGHFGDQIQSYVETNYKSLNARFSFDDSNFSGTGGALKKASNKIEKPFFVTYGDSLLSVDLKLLSKKFDPNKGPLMCIYKNDNKFDKSNCKISSGNLIYKKNNADNSFNFIDYGIGVYKNEHFKGFRNSFDLSETQEYFSKEKLLQFYIASERFYEIGSIEGLNEFRKKINTI